MKMKKAFTLIELLVVIGMLSILGALILPAIKKAKDRHMAVNQVVLEKRTVPTPTVNANAQALLDYKWEEMFWVDNTQFYTFTVGSNTIVYANHNGNTTMIRVEK